MLNLLYGLTIRAYGAGVYLASFFLPKARLWVQGRKNWRAVPSRVERPIWFHCASLGEFEQARPIIEAIKKQTPAQSILLSFYSPSGYEPRKQYALADQVVYLPLDTPANARDFVLKYQPAAACFIKYEFWYFFLRALHQQKTPIYLIAGIFRAQQVFFRPYGFFQRRWLSCFTHFFLQNEASRQLLATIHLENTSVVGDPRADRVWDIAQQSFEDAKLEAFCQNHPVWVIGSSWPADEEKILPVWDQLPAPWKLLIVPHELESNKLKSLQKRSKGSFYSTVNLEDLPDQRVLILDTMGMLSKVYRYAQICFIGGGYGKGIHNILEAAVYGKPILFGPNWKKYAEAAALLELGAAFSNANGDELKSQMDLLQTPEAYQRAARACHTYFQQNRGATQAIMKWLNSGF
ncbi:MAG: glycosyltransferase N-terminal domain-containing protein [Bacteroidota bacterium]